VMGLLEKRKRFGNLLGVPKGGEFFLILGEIATL